MSPILDDMDSRPGSTTSLLRTIIGLYLRRLGGWISVADLVELMAQLEVPATRTRTAVTRLKKKELLIAATEGRVIGYRLNDSATEMLARGDRWIFAARNMASDDAWCLIAFSLPENLRDLRHQLRRRLSWIGCGTVSAALWICPDFLSAEVEDILDDLRIRCYATVFRTERPKVAGDLRTAVALWWDLAEIETLHQTFIAQVSPLLIPEAVGPAQAFARYVRGVDQWRLIPYLDPGLPADLLPAGWPGAESGRLFADLSSRFAEAGGLYVSNLGARTRARLAN